eukprot:498337-Pyramimonas_sp.AAC.1
MTTGKSGGQAVICVRPRGLGLPNVHELSLGGSLRPFPRRSLLHVLLRPCRRDALAARVLPSGRLQKLVACSPGITNKQTRDYRVSPKLVAY